MSEASIERGRARPVLIAEDDPDDRLLIAEAFAACRAELPLVFVGDGDELLAYLRAQGPYADRTSFPLPCLIVLDLNMPRRDGREALVELSRSGDRAGIPLVVMSTSKSSEDAGWSQRHGAAAFYSKPSLFAELVELIGRLVAMADPRLPGH